MARKLTVAVAGLVHDHVWGNVAHFAKCRNTQIVAVSDPNKPLLGQFVGKYAGVKTFRDYRQMFDAVKPDIALICTTNAGSANIVEAAAQRGIHAISEKPMASKLTEADRMLKAAKKAKTHLIINWPTFWSPAVAYLAALAQKGAIGKVYQVRQHCSHEGPKEMGCSKYFYDWLYNARLNGAGALMDYCCYGAALCRYLQGKPKAVTGFRGRLVKDYISVDDNAVLLVKYADAISILEASWTQVGHIPYGVIVNGTEGALATDEKGLILADRKNPGGKRLQPPKLPLWRSNQADYFVRVIREGMPVDGWINAEVSRDAQEILEAGLISSDTNKAVRIPVPSKLRR